jgi:hypothetical protein
MACNRTNIPEVSAFQQYPFCPNMSIFHGATNHFLLRNAYIKPVDGGLSVIKMNTSTHLPFISYGKSAMPELYVRVSQGKMVCGSVKN